MIVVRFDCTPLEPLIAHPLSLRQLSLILHMKHFCPASSLKVPGWNNYKIIIILHNFTLYAEEYVIILSYVRHLQSPGIYRLEYPGL